MGGPGEAARRWRGGCRTRSAPSSVSRRIEEALCRYGPPEIFNTDQGSQFTSDDFTDTLKRRAITISMDGKGRYMDNIFVVRALSCAAICCACSSKPPFLR
jgi:transposase InsO family protein